MSYFFYAFLLIASERIVKTIRVKYIEAILRQESGWFDTSNPAELSARINKECLAIQKALGEKMGTIVMALCMTFAGLVFAFTKGWSYSLVVMAAFPFTMIATAMLSKVMQKGFKENMKAYGQSAGYAEQALNAIKVVLAFGQEEREVNNYQKYLIRAKVSGIKSHCKGTFVMGLFMGIVFWTYAYSFYMGSVWIE